MAVWKFSYKTFKSESEHVFTYLLWCTRFWGFAKFYHFSFSIFSISRMHRDFLAFIYFHHKEINLHLFLLLFYSCGSFGVWWIYWMAKWEKNNLRPLNITLSPVGWWHSMESHSCFHKLECLISDVFPEVIELDRARLEIFPCSLYFLLYYLAFCDLSAYIFFITNGVQVPEKIRQFQRREIKVPLLAFLLPLVAHKRYSLWMIS